MVLTKNKLIMNAKKILAGILTVLSFAVFGQKTETVFDVIFKEKKVGVVNVVEEKDKTKAARIIRDIKTNTEVKVMAFLIHVESELRIIKEDNILVEGTAYRHANRGSSDVQAHVKRLNGQAYEKERNGTKATFNHTGITFCVADLYFKEPKGLKTVFSNMYADHMQVKDLGKGKYQLTGPENKVSSYSYLNGRLVKVEADTPMGSVTISRP
jgi:hypothetical protein